MMELGHSLVLRFTTIIQLEVGRAEELITWMGESINTVCLPGPGLIIWLSQTDREDNCLCRQDFKESRWLPMWRRSTSQSYMCLGVAEGTWGSEWGARHPAAFSITHVCWFSLNRRQATVSCNNRDPWVEERRGQTSDAPEIFGQSYPKEAFIN